MSPHDQQLAVSSPLPAAAIVLEVSIVISLDLCGAGALARDRRMRRKTLRGFSHWTEEVTTGARRALPLQARGRGRPRH